MRDLCQLIRDYLEPRLGGVPLRDLTIGKVQAMFTALLRANGKRVHPLAPATFQRIREVLRAALNGAVRRGLITQNRVDDLPVCLGSLADQPGVEVGVTVVDNCSSDDSVAVARDHGARVLATRATGGSLLR